ncbi:hypothetical protein BY458DRAFT_436115 [Sporodiniella umbellata]|nr:hypothetical protein BY458DRAFT_436115 [Sporodiniella umbellata]
MSCYHFEHSTFKLPAEYAPIYKEECTQCFDSQDEPEGIDVCLTCFNGGCLSTERHHAKTHAQLSKHPLALNIRRKISAPNSPRGNSGRPQKMTKLAIDPSAEEPNYEYETFARCHECNGLEVASESIPELAKMTEVILCTLSASKRSEARVWEDEVTACEHTLCLTQKEPKRLEPSRLAHCAGCDLKENLWLCLTCGYLGCGREQYDGSGGNNHAIDHFKLTGHGVNVKMGTITAEGTADVYCYSCDDPKIDQDLATHLAHWDINVEHQSKTEKSMTELQLEQNLKFDFSMTTEDGKQLEPRFGPGFTGLKNLGNSCYMASVLQSVFNIPDFQLKFDQELKEHATVCKNVPANCWSCQVHKLADGLLSGRYSEAKSNKDNVQYQDGIAPTMFKAMVGRGHDEFSTMRQQDAFEFFQHFCKMTRQKEHASAYDPTHVFDFVTEQRLACTQCERVRYQKSETSCLSINVPARQMENGDYEPVDLYECLDLWVAKETVEGYACSYCKEKTTAERSIKFHTFPRILVINPRRFAFVNWVPQKLPIEIKFPEGTIDLAKYQGMGQQEGEVLLPQDEVTGGVSFNPADVEQLMAMGFSENRCQRALVNTGHQGAEVAMQWMFEHMEDTDIDEPLVFESSVGEPSEEQLEMLQDMGFNLAQAKKALKETKNDATRALDWLFAHPDETGEDVNERKGEAGDTNAPFDYQVDSFVSHKGTSVHCGHYVAHVYKENACHLFNDNKVAVAPAAPLGEAYLYFLKRK